MEIGERITSSEDRITNLEEKVKLLLSELADIIKTRGRAEIREDRRRQMNLYKPSRLAVFLEVVLAGILFGCWQRDWLAGAFCFAILSALSAMLERLEK